MGGFAFLPGAAGGLFRGRYSLTEATGCETPGRGPLRACPVAGRPEAGNHPLGVEPRWLPASFTKPAPARPGFAPGGCPRPRTAVLGPPARSRAPGHRAHGGQTPPWNIQGGRGRTNTPMTGSPNSLLRRSQKNGAKDTLPMAARPPGGLTATA